MQDLLQSIILVWYGYFYQSKYFSNHYWCIYVK